jgi:hypothetical protein
MLINLRAQPVRNVLIAAVLGLLVPTLAQATSIQIVNCNPGQVCISNQGGAAGTSGSGASTTFSLSGATVTVIGNMIQPPGSTLDFSTGTIFSGSIGSHATFNGGGTFVVNGTFAGFSGTIFTGSFSGLLSWDVVGICNANVSCTYNLTGTVNGTWYNGESLNGVTTQLFFKTKKGAYTGGTITPELGSTFIVTPEPSSLAFMGTGLLGMGLIVRRKVRGSSNERNS